jgi:hypothetical protein
MLLRKLKALSNLRGRLMALCQCRVAGLNPCDLSRASAKRYPFADETKTNHYDLPLGRLEVSETTSIEAGKPG